MIALPAWFCLVAGSGSSTCFLNLYWVGLFGTLGYFAVGGFICGWLGDTVLYDR
jgi:hypothetical protein